MILTSMNNYGLASLETFVAQFTILACAHRNLCADISDDRQEGDDVAFTLLSMLFAAVFSQ